MSSIPSSSAQAIINQQEIITRIRILTGSLDRSIAALSFAIRSIQHNNQGSTNQSVEKIVEELRISILQIKDLPSVVNQGIQLNIHDQDIDQIENGCYSDQFFSNLEKEAIKTKKALVYFHNRINPDHPLKMSPPLALAFHCRCFCTLQ